MATSSDLELRRRDGRHLIVVKPELEECVLRSFTRVRMSSELPATASDLRRVPNLPNPTKHALFREELAEAHRLARNGTIRTFTTELEAVVRGLQS